MKWLVFVLWLRPLIKRNYKMRAAGVLPDEWYWADELAFDWGYIVTNEGELFPMSLRWRVFMRVMAWIEAVQAWMKKQTDYELFLYRLEYSKRWRQRFMDVTGCEAEFADSAWDSISFEEHATGYAYDPEGSADEEVSYFES